MSMKHTHGIGSRCASLFLAVMLLVAMAIVPASAENEGVTGDGETGISSIPVSLVINTDGNTYAPKTDFTIEVSTGAKGTYNDGTSDEEVEVNGGITGGLSGCTITSDPNTAGGPSASYTLQGNLTVNLTAFTGATPGIYHYEVREKAGSYEGITYDSKTYDVYLYLMRTAGNELYIGYAVCVDSGTDAKAALTFTNDYGKTNDTTHDVTVEKVVTGDMANMSDTFTFSVSVNGATGEVYKVVYTQSGIVETTSVTSGSTINLDKIGNDDTIHIYGLSATDTYTVTETDNQGYTVSDDDTDSAAGTVDGTVAADNSQHTITNTKDAATPTGIIMSVAPYALLVVLAAGACVVFLRRRGAED